jgi:hypothetical protein
MKRRSNRVHHIERGKARAEKQQERTFLAPQAHEQRIEARLNVLHLDSRRQ